MDRTPNLLPKYSSIIRNMTAANLANPETVADLAVDHIEMNNKRIEMVYAPFDHVNLNARLVIVGLTPGKQQAANALLATRNALAHGASDAVAGEEAKVFASFSGPMRANLVKMLDFIGVARLLGIASTAELWGQHQRLVHFTSALRYPVFVDGKNWSGQPDMVRTTKMRGWLEEYTGSELALLADPIVVPLGSKVCGAMQHLASLGLTNEAKILSGLPHPSGANAERIAYFLGRKPVEQCSTRIDAAALDGSRFELRARVAALGRELEWAGGQKPAH